MVIKLHFDHFWLSRWPTCHNTFWFQAWTPRIWLRNALPIPAPALAPCAEISASIVQTRYGKEQDTKWMAEQYTFGLIATAPLQALLWLVVLLRTIAKKRIHKADVVYSNWPTFISSMARSWVYHIMSHRKAYCWHLLTWCQRTGEWTSNETLYLFGREYPGEVRKDRCAFKYVQTRLCGQADL